MLWKRQAKVRKELTLEGGIGVLPRAETLKRAVFPAGCTLGAEVRAGGAGCWASRALARAGCACPGISVWSRRQLLKWLSLSAWQTPLWFPECTSWIPFRWNSNQRMHSRRALNALGWLLGVAPVGAKLNKPPARTRLQALPCCAEWLTKAKEPRIKEHPLAWYQK